jgi:hypothetical protein
MKRRPYNPQFAAPIKSRRDRLDEAVERDNQVAARRTREYEAAQARETLSAAEYKIACAVPPAGWHCTRKAGHSGPCAAHPAEPEAPASVPAAPHAQAEPVPFRLGNEYQTQAGDWVRFETVHNEGKDYETMADQHGHHRYTRRDFGRVTGAAHDYSYAGNTPPLYAAPVPQEAEQAFAWAAFADNGNVIIWSHQRSVVEPVAARYGKPVVAVIALRTEKAAQEAEQAAPTAVTVPEGWLLVSREPSQEQLNYAAYNINRKRNGPDMVTPDLLRECWSNLLYARPAAPAVTDDAHTLNTTDFDGQKDEKFEHKAAPAVTEAEQASVLRDMLAIQEACNLHTDEYAPGSVIEYIKELEAEQASVLAARAAALEEAAQACKPGLIANATAYEIAAIRKCAAAIRARINPAATKG